MVCELRRSALIPRSSAARVFSFAALCAVTFPGVSAEGQAKPADPRGKLIVSTEWLAANIKDPNLVLLHVGDAEEYIREHIPGARFVSLRSISSGETHAANALHLEMLPGEKLRTALESLGISDKSRVVVYYGNDWVTPATRVVFTLDYAGLGSRTVLLDGGMQAWKRDGGKVTTTAASQTPGKLSSLAIRPLVVDAAWVRENVGKPGIVLVDARAAAFYDGVQSGGGMTAPHRTGHIAGAKSVPDTEIANEQNFLRAQNELAAAFAKAGVKAGDTVVAYCHIGQQATGTLFAARLLGHPVRLYDGSFEDWSARADYPVTNPSQSGSGK